MARGWVAPQSGDGCVPARSVGTRWLRFQRTAIMPETPDHPQPSRSRGQFLQASGKILWRPFFGRKRLP